MMGSLCTASDSPTINVERLQKAFERVIAWADQNGLKIDMNTVVDARKHNQRA